MKMEIIIVIGVQEKESNDIWQKVMKQKEI